MSTFATLMNMPPSMTKVNFKQIDSNLFNSYSDMGDKSMKEASEEIHDDWAAATTNKTPQCK